MKKIQLFFLLGFLLIFSFGNGQSKNHDKNWQIFSEILYDNFPYGVTFSLQEKEKNNLNETLTYAFHFPEVKWSQDTLTLSYVVEYKEYSNDIIYEKIVWSIPVKCIIECDFYQFTYGAFDYFEPILIYWSILVDTECGLVKKDVYNIKNVNLDNKNPFEEIELQYSDVNAYAQFPISKKPTKKRVRELNKITTQIKK